MTNRSEHEFPHTGKTLLEEARQKREILYKGYKLTEPIAKGAEGEVYRADSLSKTDEHTEAAIKIYGSKELQSIGRQALIAQEVSDHPNVPEIYNYGKVNIVDSANARLARLALGSVRQAITMQYINGPTLQEYTKQGLSTDEAVLIGTRLADTLGHIHTKGYVHLDVKGLNIIMDAGTVPILTDFGITRKIGETDAANGTVVTMPPEQRKAGPREASMDIYAWGVEMHRLLTGEYPRRDKSTSELRASIKDILKQEQGAQAEQLPAQLNNIIPLIQSCLDPNPENRPANMAFIKRELTQGYYAGLEQEKVHPTENAFQGIPAISKAKPSDEEVRQRQHESRSRLTEMVNNVTVLVPLQPEPSPSRPGDTLENNTKFQEPHTEIIPLPNKAVIAGKDAFDDIRKKYEDRQKRREAIQAARPREERAMAIIRSAVEKKEWERREKFEAARAAAKLQRKEERERLEKRKDKRISEAERHKNRKERSVGRQRVTREAARQPGRERAYQRKLIEDRRNERKKQPSRRLVLKATALAVTAAIPSVAVEQYFHHNERLSDKEESKRLVAATLNELLIPTGEERLWNSDIIRLLAEHDTEAAKSFIESRSSDESVYKGIINGLADIAPYDPDYAHAVGHEMIDHYDRTDAIRDDHLERLRDKMGVALAKESEDLALSFVTDQFGRGGLGQEMVELALSPKSSWKLRALLNGGTTRNHFNRQRSIADCMSQILSAAQGSRIVGYLENGVILSSDYRRALDGSGDNSKTVSITPKYLFAKGLVHHETEFAEQVLQEVELKGHFDAAVNLAASFIPENPAVTLASIDRYRHRNPSQQTAEAINSLILALANTSSVSVSRPEDETYALWFDYSRQPDNANLRKLALDAFYKLAPQERFRIGNTISLSLMYNQRYSD